MTPSHAPSFAFARATRAWRAALVLAAILMLAAPSVAFARWGQPGWNVSLSATSPVAAGQNATAVATVKDGWGRTVTGAGVTFYLDRGYVGKATTNAQGRASVTVPGARLTVVGQHYVSASAGGVGRGSAYATIQVVPATSGVPGPIPKPAPLNTAVSLQMPTGSQVGQDVPLTATLRDAYGRPVAGQHIQLFIDGSELSGGHTDASGRAAMLLPGRKLDAARSYQVKVQFSGGHGYQPSNRTATLAILAAAIQIATVPPVSGISFSLAGQTATTGPDGVADLPVPATGSYPLTVDLNPDDTGSGPIRVSFLTWSDGDTNTNRNLFVHGPAAYSVGLRVAYLAGLQFADASGEPIDPATISDATIKASDGAVVSLSGATGVQFWCTSGVAAATHDEHGGPALVAHPVTYRAESVKVRGVEALVDGQAEWTPAIGASWTIRLGLYDLQVRTQDAFFGDPTSEHIRLSWADGSTSVASPGPDGLTVFDSLPAGNYTLDVNSAPMNASVAVVMDGAKETTLNIVTGRDAAVGVAVLLALLGLAVVAAALYRAKRRRLRAQPAG